MQLPVCQSTATKRPWEGKRKESIPSASESRGRAETKVPKKCPRGPNKSLSWNRNRKVGVSRIGLGVSAWLGIASYRYHLQHQISCTASAARCEEEGDLFALPLPPRPAPIFAADIELCFGPYRAPRMPLNTHQWVASPCQTPSSSQRAALAVHEIWC